MKRPRTAFKKIYQDQELYMSKIKQKSLFIKPNEVTIKIPSVEKT